MVYGDGKPIRKVLKNSCWTIKYYSWTSKGPCIDLDHCSPTGMWGHQTGTILSSYSSSIQPEYRHKNFSWCLLTQARSCSPTIFIMEAHCLCLSGHVRNRNKIRPDRKGGPSYYLGLWKILLLYLGKKLQPLVPLLNTKHLDNLPPHILRFHLRLSRFEYFAQHVPGCTQQIHSYVHHF